MEPLTNKIIDFVNNQKLGYVATVCPDNTPNLSPKGTIIAWDSNHLAFADIRSPNTISNLEKNPIAEINIVDPILRRGYRFKGSAKILSGGQVFEKILSHYKSKGVKSKINSVVLVEVREVSEVTSPLYDLGYTEEQIKEKWKKHYFSF